MADTVKVRLRKPPRVFNFICRDIPLIRDEGCVVRTDRGLEYGVCVLPPEEASPGEEDRLKMTVVRRASHHDETTFKQIQMDEDRAKQVCKDKIRERDLTMKLVECEYAFDRKKIVFYFTAEDRVDFRELVRDLAREFKARIELRHIQVRDEAKLVGGIGSCGRELCCTTWMREFVPISMRMAKRQNLSLNPGKISGQCGRLLCCLSYENDQYERARKKAPKERSNPAALREEMEAAPKKVVEALVESARSDDAVDRAKAQESLAKPGELDRPSVRGEGDGDSGRTSNAESTAGEDTKSKGGARRGGRGRGRRRRRGKGSGDGGGGGSTSSNG